MGHNLNLHKLHLKIKVKISIKNWTTAVVFVRLGVRTSDSQSDYESDSSKLASDSESGLYLPTTCIISCAVDHASVTRDETIVLVQRSIHSNKFIFQIKWTLFGTVKEALDLWNLSGFFASRTLQHWWRSRMKQAALTRNWTVFR